MGMNDRRQSAKEEKAVTRGLAPEGEAAWRGYINVDLTDAEKTEFVEWAMTDRPWQVLDNAVQAGVVITLKQNVRGGGCLASATQRRASSVNAGLCVTARASWSATALMRVVFLLERLGVASDWAAAHPLADPDRW